MTLGTRLIAGLSGGVLLALSAGVQNHALAEEPAADFFEKQVSPILVGHCYDCHSADTETMGGLRLDDRDSLVRGGDSGPAVVPGHPEKSLLVSAIHYADKDLQMPPDGKLSVKEIGVLTEWIRGGAPWPAAVTQPGQPQDQQTAAAVDFFEKRVRPLLANQCYNCHSADTNSKGGLRVDDRNGLLLGGNRGPAVVPGDPDGSLLMKAVRREHKQVQMPPKSPLSEEQIADLAQWIADGAAWPEVRVPAYVGKPNARYDQLRAEHWAWQPLEAADPPQVRDVAWPRDDVDRFILARLESENLAPMGDAGKHALLRRVTLDLTGLPPTLSEVDAFLADDSPQALEHVVDRLLASAAFGEKWGRHWLDVARYGESTGSARNLPYPHAWRYRDYVIDAFNNDKPFDQFLREQIAGDLLPAATQQERDERLIATGFLALGVKDVNQRFKVRYVMDNIDEQIDAVTRSVLALTVSCARCHDHKFDPIPTTDYYALAGIFHSSDLCDGLRNKMGGGGLDYYNTDMLLALGAKSGAGSGEEKIRKAREAIAQAQAEVARIRDEPDTSLAPAEREKQFQAARKRVTELQNELNRLSDPAIRGPVALGVRESSKIGDTQIRIRGEAEQLGPMVPRGFLSVVAFPDQPQVNPSQSGRLELAQWLTSRHNPLTPRVIVNRIWQHLFGEGIVTSVDNFGVTGDVPSHPELLDYLAQQFMDDGWSVKAMVRRLVLTRAYQMSSDATQEHLAADPANRLVWRHSPRRMQAEELRDAMLALSGALDRKRLAGSPAKGMRVIEVQANSAEAKRIEAAATGSTHRSIYLPLLRTLTPASMEVFDFAEQGLVTGRRDTTTVAPQALFMLNDPFVHRSAQAIAKRALEKADADEDARVDGLYRLIVGRGATDMEIARARSYMIEYAAMISDSQPSAANPAAATNGKTAAAKGKQAAAKEAVDPQLAAWTSFCQALLGSAEFRYVR